MTDGPPRGVLATLCLTVTVSYGTLYYAFAVLAPAITRDTGWSMTAITAAFSIGSLATGVAGVWAGRFIQAGGPRGVMVAGGLTGSVGLALLAWSPSYPVFLLAMLVGGAAAAGLFYAPAFAAITHWHGVRRVEALTTLTLVAGFASTVFAPLTAWLEEQVGWRNVYVVFAILLLVVTVPLHALVLNRRWQPADATGGPSDREVVRSRGFLLVAAGATLTTLAMYASLIALVPLLVERGMSTSTAAWALGLGGAGQVAGRLLYPRLSRRLPIGPRATLVTGTVAVTVAGLALIPGPMILLIAVSVVAGAARGLYTLVGATLVSDLWGPQRYAALNGVLGAPVAVAGALGPFVAAWIAMGAGGYPVAFLVLAVLATAGAGLLAAGVRAVPERQHHPFTTEV